MAPHTPQRSERSGGAGALLYSYGGPDMAPTPQRSERPGGAGALLYIPWSYRTGLAEPLFYSTLAITVRTRSARSWAAARESVVGFTASAGW